MPRTGPDCHNWRYAMLTTGHTRGAVSEQPQADSPQASPGKAGTLVAGGTTPHALEAQAWEGLCTTARPGSCQTPAQGQACDPSGLLWLDWTPWATPRVAQLPGAGTDWVSTGAPPCCLSGLAGSAVRRCMRHSCKLQAVTWRRGVPRAGRAAHAAVMCQGVGLLAEIGCAHLAIISPHEVGKVLLLLCLLLQLDPSSAYSAHQANHPAPGAATSGSCEVGLDPAFSSNNARVCWPPWPRR